MSAAACRRGWQAAGRLMRSAWSFTFEPLFAVLGAVALVAYVRAWRREGASA